MQGKKKWIFKTGILTIISLGILVYVLNVTAEESSGEDFVLSINGIEIPVEEFRMFVQDQKANTSDYFYKKYGVEDSDTFWQDEYENEIPLHVAKTYAMKKLVEFKVEQELAVEYGVLESPLFNKIREDLKKERSEYGVESESLNLFQEYMIYNSKIFIETMNKFKSGFNGVKEEDIQAYYNENKRSMFTQEDDMEVLQINLAISDDDKEISILDILIDDLQKGLTEGELVEKYTGLNAFNIQRKTYGSNEGKDENSSELEALLKKQAYMLEENQISEPIQHGDQYFIIVSQERHEGIIQAYEEVKSVIENMLKEENFYQKVEVNIKEAVIIVNDDKFNQIQMD